MAICLKTAILYGSSPHYMNHKSSCILQPAHHRRRFSVPHWRHVRCRKKTRHITLHHTEEQQTRITAEEKKTYDAPQQRTYAMAICVSTPLQHTRFIVVSIILRQMRQRSTLSRDNQSLFKVYSQRPPYGTRYTVWSRRTLWEMCASHKKYSTGKKKDEFRILLERIWFRKVEMCFRTYRIQRNCTFQEMVKHTFTSEGKTT